MATPFRVKLDPDADAPYFRITDRRVARTIELEALVLLDVDEDDAPVGLEFVDADEFVPFMRRRGGTFDPAATVA